MIDEVRRSLDSGDIDEYSVTVRGGKYLVAVAKGKSKTGEGSGDSEAEAFSAAKRDLK